MTGRALTRLLALLALTLTASLGCRSEQVAIDLVATFPSAKQQSPEPFEVVQATIKGETRPAILTKAPSRITWRIDVPRNAWLRVGVALREDAWTIKGDGVMFYIGLTHDKSGQLEYEDVMSFLSNPFENPADRGWNEVNIDLGEHAGRSVEVIFRALPSYSPPGQPRDDRNGDFALWGAPRITSK